MFTAQNAGKRQIDLPIGVAVLYVNPGRRVTLDNRYLPVIEGKPGMLIVEGPDEAPGPLYEPEPGPNVPPES